MTTVIKNGTIVTADLTYKADVLIDQGKIIEIGPNLSGDRSLDATGCYVMPGGIDPHTHLEMPFMGTYSADDFESGTRAALAGGTTMVVDFVLPGQGVTIAWPWYALVGSSVTVVVALLVTPLLPRQEFRS